MVCSCKNCDYKKDTKDKRVKVYFCPDCKSTNVRYFFEIKNLFGILPKMRCLDCKKDMPCFPMVSTTENEIKKGVEQLLSDFRN